jgi:uncharacterized membrane protein SpoIIM required for sporulation
MIIDLQRFVQSERATWSELEKLLDQLETGAMKRRTIAELQHFHLLYERTAADLARLTTFSAEPETRRYLETLIARAYGEIHETRERRRRLHPLRWFFHTLPQTFRRHIRAFYLSVAITIVGALFGAFAIAFDPTAKPVLMPFEHLLQDPAKRVAQEERLRGEADSPADRLSGRKSSFSAQLMTHNTRVSVFTMALGVSYGVGTTIVLFFNGIMIGAIAVDYVRAGQTKFLLGWLLPHGVIEIPAILIAGQAGLMLAFAMIGWGRRVPLATRLREISSDVVTLIFGVACLLVWAGFIEAFLSQYHEPVIPYELKIGFGLVELTLLVLFLSRSGRNSSGLAEGTPEADASDAK